MDHVLQNALRIVAALSHSLSMLSGRKAWLPSLLVRVLIGPAALMLICERRSPQDFLPESAWWPWLVDWSADWLPGGGAKTGAAGSYWWA